MSLDSESKKISLYHFEPLDEGNYQECQTRIAWKLEELEFEQHTDPSISPPTQDEEEEWVTWSKDDRRATRTIGGHLSSINVARLLNARQQWKCRTPAVRVFASKAHWGTSTSEHDSEIPHCRGVAISLQRWPFWTDIENCVLKQPQLPGLSVPVHILAMYIVLGLPPSWLPWIEAITSHHLLLNKRLTSICAVGGVI